MTGGSGKQPPKGRGSGTNTPRTDTPGASGGATPKGVPPQIDLAEKYKELVEQLRAQVDRKEEYKGQLVAERKERAELDTKLNALTEELQAMANQEQGAAGGAIARDIKGNAKVPFFFGDESDVYSPTLWMTNIEQLATTNGWTDVQKLNATLMSLQGPAGVWRESESDRKPEDFRDWARFKTEFLARFQPSTTAVEAVKLIAGLQKRQDEPVRQFFDRVNRSVNLSTADSLRAAKLAWGDNHQRQEEGYKEARSHFVKALFVNGLPPSIRSVVEAKFSSLATLDDVLNAAIEAEVAASSSGAAKIMELEQQIAALRVATGGGPSRGNPPPRFYNTPAGRGRGGANPGGNPGSGPAAPGLSHKQRVAIRSTWVLCHKCGQWGKHYARECKVGPQKLAELVRQDPNKPPSGPVRDPWFDAALSAVSGSQATPLSDSKN
jgi:hypothetical protein